ncbi:preprotein translocase subunit SecG [Aliikangiella coralliicola]|uniref:Protein-export membrane protein SecG n=1 Tax=Aliikangiella coralliicola TaxID=2592383 RepID=A0A545UHP2_9GAMM|nr:preprotein translocase subunit SecG [Aliikangiella coralliicola]TQV88994.1 preprotein translocase subunit SecG [Aliikangiella coralliicola]
MEIILIIYLVVSIALIGIILLQQGKGAEMGASFGAGGANTVFGAAGSGNVLTKTTTVLAILFFAIALGISFMKSKPTVETDSVIDEVITEQEAAPKSLEAELPTTEGGLEAEVAPTEQKQDATTAEEKLKDAQSKVESDIDKAKAKVEEKTEEVAKKEEKKEDETDK